MRRFLISIAALTLLFAFTPMAAPSRLGADAVQSVHDADAVACRPLRGLLRGLGRGLGRAFGRARSC